MKRHLKFFALGFFQIKPLPGHRDLRCWLHGGFVSFSLALATLPVGLIAIGYALGKY